MDSPHCVRPHDWAYWRPDARKGDFYKSMLSPPPGRERFVIGQATIDKVLRDKVDNEIFLSESCLMKIA